MSDRPGFMVYHDLFDDLQEFSADEVCLLFLALGEYSQNGTEPKFEDRALRAVFRGAKRKLDRDSEQYQKTIIGRKYATYCRECAKSGAVSLSREEWEHQMISNDTA